MALKARADISPPGVSWVGTSSPFLPERGRVRPRNFTKHRVERMLAISAAERIRKF